MRSSFRLKHIKRRKGGRYVYLALPGREWVRLPDLPENHPAFIAAYAEAARSAATVAPVRGPKAGTVAALVAAYRASAAWRDLAETTRQGRRAHLDDIQAKGGEALLSGLRERHVRADLRDRKPNAFNARLKVWKALFAFATDPDVGMVKPEDDPARMIRKKAVKTAGHRTWGRDHIDAFRAAHPADTKARLVFELALWTGARRADLVRLGWPMVDGSGWLAWRQQKTGGEVAVPLVCKLPAGCAELAGDYAAMREALAHVPAPPLTNYLTFFVTERGEAHSVKGIGNSFKEWVRAAGLPDNLSLHGLRKARATALKEAGWADNRIGAWTGHKSASEVAHYTAAANLRRLIEGPERERNMGNPVLRFSQKGEKAQ